MTIIPMIISSHPIKELNDAWFIKNPYVNKKDIKLPPHNRAE